jgi:3-methyladenine DNA glycosylase AlkD
MSTAGPSSRAQVSSPLQASGPAQVSGPAGAAGQDEAAAIERELRAAGTAERAVSAKAYLKSDLEFTGTTVPVIRAQVRSWRRARPGLSREALIAVVTPLWSRPVFECRQTAVVLLTDSGPLLTAADAAQIEEMLRAAGTWALVDGLAADVMGPLVERQPELTATLDRWAADADFWLRRSALLALLLPLRRGDGDFGRFARYADQMLDEREFFIRKAIGWVLRETGKRRPDLVAAWLAPRVTRASGVTVREAVKPLSPGQRAELLAAYQVGRTRPAGTGQPRSPG